MSSLLAKKQHGENCVICEENKRTGIHLYTSFICMECEKSIISTDTSDPRYKFFLKKLKKINKPEIYS